MVKKNFNRKSLSDKIYQNLGFSKNYSSVIVDDVFNNIISELEKLKKVKINSFGTFEVIKKKERIGRNPKTKVETKISARKIVKFKASDFFKNQINKK